MFRQRAILAAVASVVLVIGAAAQPQHGSKSESIAGEWAITFTIAGQTASGTITFAVDGDKLTGNVDSHHTGPGTLENGKWSNGKLSAKCVFEKHESIALDGEFKDGKLSGTFHTEGMEGTWEATRAAKVSSSIR